MALLWPEPPPSSHAERDRYPGSDTRDTQGQVMLGTFTLDRRRDKLPAGSSNTLPSSKR